jgi:hypothetical protein
MMLAGVIDSIIKVCEIAFPAILKILNIFA